jgi:adenylate cyclase
MADVFISYAHTTGRQAQAAAAALREAGYSVWLDDDLAVHRSFTQAIEEQLTAAKAALVIWSAAAARSEWVLSEANRAREEHKLVQLRVDGARLPMPFDQIQCADLGRWSGESKHPAWRKVVDSVAELVKDGAKPADLTPVRITAPAPPLPDRPSIAVLPLADPTGAVEGDYFADGMVDEIVNVLSRFPSLFVIASGSSLSYRERERDFRKIGRELGVRYLLEGSVRRSGQRVRIAVGLVEAESEAQIWSDRFEGALDDVFALQDEVANAVAARIEPAIQTADLRRGAARPTEDLGAYDLFLRAMQRAREFDRAGFEAAIALLEQSTARDPRFATAWGLLSALHADILVFGWAADPEETTRKAQDAIRRALLASDEDAVALSVAAMGSVMLGGERSVSLAMADRALTLNPGSFICCMFAGYVSAWSSQFDQALERFGRSLRLNPRAPERAMALTGMGLVLVGLQRFDEAIPILNEAVTLRPNFPGPLFSLATALAHLGKIEEAKAALAKAEALGSLRNSTFEAALRTGAWADIHRLALERLGLDPDPDA